MRLKNTTHWPDHFLRRLVAWTCKEIGLPVRSIRLAEFGKRSRGAFNGRAWSSGRIRIVIGPASAFPVEPHLYPGRTSDAFMSPRMADQTEGLVAVTAHEVEHIYGYRNRKGKHRHSERFTRGEERRIMDLFRAQRDALLAEWNETQEVVAKPRRPVQDIRAEKAQKMIAAWERKMKLARTKIAKYKRQVRYYERVAATRTAGD